MCFSPPPRTPDREVSGGTPSGTRRRTSDRGSSCGAVHQANAEKVHRLARLAEDLDVPLVALALRWCLRRPEVSSCIVGASRSEQVVQNTDASDLAWDDALAERIEAVIG